MSAAPTSPEVSQDAVSWAEANRALLDAQLERLRLLLQRRVQWLRRHWAEAAPPYGFGWRITDAEADRLLAGEDRAAEARFYAGEDCADISGALGRIADAIAVRRQALQAAGTPASLDVICHIFGLGHFERDVLLLALAPELDGDFERLYAYVQDDVARRHATAHLALSLLLAGENEPLDAKALFGPDGALRRNRLVICEEGSPPVSLPHRPLRVEERVVDFVFGVNRPDRRVEQLLDPVPPPLLTHNDQVIAAEATSWLRDAPERLLRRAVNLTGPAGARKPHLARAICEAVGIGLARLDPTALASVPGERAELIALLEREAALINIAFYIEPAPAAGEVTGPLMRELDHIRALLFIASPAGQRVIERECLVRAVPQPSAAERIELWQTALAGAGIADPAETAAAAVEQFDVEASEIAATAAAAQARAAAHGAAVTAADLWAACRERTAPALDELAQPIVPCYGWDDIVLPLDAAEQLRDIAGQVRHRATVYRRWGFGAKLVRGQGISALFAGPSGTGKTMAAEILAGELELGLYRIDLAGVVSKYIGETEKNLRRIFDAAEAGGAVLFFDEADALFGKRSEVKDSHDRYANIEVNYLLQRMEDFRGLAILATNRRSALDAAFVRRLRFIVEFPFPDTRQRQEIWCKVFPRETELEGIDFAWLARLEIPGGNIRNIALSAAFLAAAKPEPIGMRHILRAARREYRKMERLVPDAEFAPLQKATAQ
jgi:hypothetical protein